MVKETARLEQIELGIKSAPPSLDEAASGQGACLYAWWARRGSLQHASPTIPLTTINKEAEWGLLYVAGSPRSERRRNARLDRVIRNHWKGNIGSSTFRLSLAALLIDFLCLEPLPGDSRPRLANEDRLTTWITENCRATVVNEEEPWRYEKAVIGSLDPPLNIRFGIHEFRYPLDRARKALLLKCGIERVTSLR